MFLPVRVLDGIAELLPRLEAPLGSNFLLRLSYRDLRIAVLPRHVAIRRILVCDRPPFWGHRCLSGVSTGVSLAVFADSCEGSSVALRSARWSTPTVYGL